MLHSAFGMLVLTALAWAMSENRRKVKLRPLVAALILQFLAAVLLLKIPASKQFFLFLNSAAAALDQATTAGTSFVFGYLGGAPLPFDEKAPGMSFILAVKALPVILVVSALSALLFHWRIIPAVVRLFSLALQKTTGVGGAVGVGVSANIFMGMVEAPLLVRPYINRMTRSELFTLMTCGMATIAGTVLVLYAMIISSVVPDAMGQIMTASIISCPAAIMVSLLMVPETGEVTAGNVVPPYEGAGTMDVLIKGTTEGTKLLINVAAMLIVLVALVHLANQILALLPHSGNEPWSLQGILGDIMAPVVWLIGIPWSEAPAAGELMGIKTVLNEFLAYSEMASLPPGLLSERSRLIMTYALCGFANFGSLGIMVGGLTALAPERRTEIGKLGLKSMVSGTLSTLMTGAVVGVVL